MTDLPKQQRYVCKQCILYFAGYNEAVKYLPQVYLPFLLQMRRVLILAMFYRTCRQANVQEYYNTYVYIT